MLVQGLSNVYDLRDKYAQFYFDYSENTLYRDERLGEENFFNNYFEQDKSQLRGRKLKYVNWITAWTSRADAWHNPDPELRAELARLLQKHMTVKRALRDKIESLRCAKFVNKRVLGLHKRGTDHWAHGKLLPLEYYFQEVDKRMKDFDSLYLATDEEGTLSAFKHRYGDRLICLEEVLRSHDDRPVHKNNFLDNYRKGEEVITEAILLAKVEHLLKTRSNVTLFSILYNPSLTYHSIDSHIRYRTG